MLCCRVSIHSFYEFDALLDSETKVFAGVFYMFDVRPHFLDLVCRELRVAHVLRARLHCFSMAMFHLVHALMHLDKSSVSRVPFAEELFVDALHLPIASLQFRHVLSANLS